MVWSSDSEHEINQKITFRGARDATKNITYIIWNDWVISFAKKNWILDEIQEMNSF